MRKLPSTGDNLSKIARTQLKQNVTAPILAPEVAGAKAQLSTKNVTKLDYDVNGEASVQGGQLQLVPDLAPNTASAALVQGNTEATLANIVKNAQKRNYTEQVSFESLGDQWNKGIDVETTYTDRASNTGLITYVVADGIYYVDPRLYDSTNLIDHTQYIPSMDAFVMRMVNGAKDQFSPQARRFARLARAFKDSIIAQTNDTNPFYSMPVAEIFDRITDYFYFVDHSIAGIKTAEFWLDVRKLVVNGDRLYSDLYTKLYTSDFVVKLEDILGRAKASLIGAYYDKTSLAEFLINGVPSLAPKQNGAVRMLVPLYGKTLSQFPRATWVSALDPIASRLLFPHLDGSVAGEIEKQQAAILQYFETIINRAYSSDNSIIQTAFAAFNGVPVLTDINRTKPRVGSLIINQLNSNVQVGRGGLDVMAQTKAGIQVFGVPHRFPAGITTATATKQLQHTEANEYLASNSMLANYNGILSVVTATAHQGHCYTANTPDSFIYGAKKASEADPLVCVFCDRKVIYGQSILFPNRLPAMASGITNSPVFNLKDTEWKFDLLDAGQTHTYDGDGVANALTKVKQTPWYGVKYKYIFNIHGGDYYAVARACLHSGDSVLKMLNVGTPSADAVAELLSNKHECLMGHSDVGVGIHNLRGAGAGHRWTSTDTDNLSVNYLSHVDSACMIMTQTLARTELFDDCDLKAYCTNIGQQLAEYVDCFPNYDLGYSSFLQSVPNLGVIYANWKGYYGIGDGGFGYGAPSFYTIYDYFEGFMHERLDNQYDCSIMRAQYLDGISSESEEAI